VRCRTPLFGSFGGQRFAFAHPTWLLTPVHIPAAPVATASLPLHFPGIRHWDTARGRREAYVDMISRGNRIRDLHISGRLSIKWLDYDQRGLWRWTRWWEDVEFDRIAWVESANPNFCHSGRLAVVALSSHERQHRRWVDL